MNYQKTQHGTEIIDGVERSSPPPAFVIKAMKRQRAEDLAFRGELRLSSFEYYKGLEHNEIGDKSEGQGLYSVGEDQAHMGSAYAVFLFCASLPDTNPKNLISLHSGYDTIIRINKLEAFAQTIADAAFEQHQIVLKPIIGPVNYDRGAAASYPEINTKPWGWNIFQKDPRYSHQREYRFAFEHFSTFSVHRHKTEEELLAELHREHVELNVSFPSGTLEILAIS